MADPRLELSRLTGGDGAAVVGALDSFRIVIEAPPERSRSRDDQVGLYNLVAGAARLFPRLELRVSDGIECDLGPLATGELCEGLAALHADLRPKPTAEAVGEIHLAWGQEPDGEGIAADASGWSYSVGPTHLALERSGGPAVGAIAASSFAVAQCFGRVLEGQLPFHATPGFVANLLDYRNEPAGRSTLMLAVSWAR